MSTLYCSLILFFCFSLVISFLKIQVSSPARVNFQPIIVTISIYEILIPSSRGMFNFAFFFKKKKYLSLTNMNHIMYPSSINLALGGVISNYPFSTPGLLLLNYSEKTQGESYDIAHHITNLLKTLQVFSLPMKRAHAPVKRQTLLISNQ